MFVGNFDVDVEHQQRIGHLFGPLPKEMRDDTAFMDRLHAYIPGWDVPKMNADLFTEHFGLVSDFLAECWNQLRVRSLAHLWQPRVQFGGALSGRDTTAVNKTVDGLLKLLYPGAEQAPADEDIEWAVRLALESRRRVKEQQKRIGAAEFRNTHFSYTLGEDGVEQFVATPEIQSEDSIGVDPLPPGQVWGISPGGQDENPGLYRIEVNVNPGSGVKVLNKPCPPPFQESIKFAEQNLLARAKELVGDRDPRHHEFMVQLRAFDAAKSGANAGRAGPARAGRRAAREEPQGRPDRRRRHQPRRHHRPGLQRRERRGAGDREGRRDRAHAGELRASSSTTSRTTWRRRSTSCTTRTRGMRC